MQMKSRKKLPQTFKTFPDSSTLHHCIGMSFFAYIRHMRKNITAMGQINRTHQWEGHRGRERSARCLVQQCHSTYTCCSCPSPGHRHCQALRGMEPGQSTWGWGHHTQVSSWKLQHMRFQIRGRSKRWHTLHTVKVSGTHFEHIGMPAYELVTFHQLYGEISLFLGLCVPGKFSPVYPGVATVIRNYMGLRLMVQVFVLIRLDCKDVTTLWCRRITFPIYPWVP